ncbi:MULTISPECIES: alpha/beta hydrolase [unclassified Arthrobacter]|uniref:alpha/beta hydrolase n=1 Tax=unclassified Arthrobacter TaxID=235627 RepID=UPI001492354D|nr:MULTISPECIES: alpha/beta hydrolase [unclassified Arthrobacter]MBE0010600.1 alpha/beta hydrolase [Arthrobacter sp. AET 35A]NOJ64385.1 alpha/beta hydrolase [Arthrobacter sp. 147(2020)]
MTNVDQWPHLYDAGKPDSPVLLLLHGTGGTEHDLLQLAQRLSPQAGYLAPRGPVQEQGMNRWFRRFGEGKFDVDDVVRRAGELADFIEWARGNYGLGERKVIAVGFSNGANIALATVLLHPQALTDVVSFSGMYPLGDRSFDGDLSGTAVALFNGEADAMAPLTSVTQLKSVLDNAGSDVHQAVREGGHGVHPTEVDAAATWIGSRTAPAAR